MSFNAPYCIFKIYKNIAKILVNAYFITFSLGIQNTILYRTYTSIQQDITYEVLIFMFLSFIEAFIYHIKFELVIE